MLRLGVFLLVIAAAMSLVIGAETPAPAPSALAPFQVRAEKVKAFMDEQKIGLRGSALYDNAGRPLMTPDGRQAVSIEMVDLAPPAVPGPEMQK